MASPFNILFVLFIALAITTAVLIIFARIVPKWIIEWLLVLRLIKISLEWIIEWFPSVAAAKRNEKGKKPLRHQKLPRNCRGAKFHQKIRWRIIGACSYCTKQISPKPVGKNNQAKKGKANAHWSRITESLQGKKRYSATIPQNNLAPIRSSRPRGGGVHLLVHFSFLNRLQGDCLS